MSLSPPSHVSATTGNDHSSPRMRPRRTTHSITASRTTPTECVFVIITGPHRNPDSSTQVVPVISPLPFIVNQPANTGSSESLPRGKIAVTPVRTGPFPTTSLPFPSTSVRWPTSMPPTSVMASRGPGVPSNGMPKARPRSGRWARVTLEGTATSPARTNGTSFMGGGRIRAPKPRSKRPRRKVAPREGALDSWAYDEHRFPISHHADLVLAGESCPALQPVVRAAAVVVLPGARGAARARRALRSQRGRRDPASPVHGGSGHLGPAVLHGLPDRRGIVAGGARHARSRIAAPEPRVGDDAGRGARARADLRLRGGGRDLWRARHASDARDPWRTRDGL